MSVSQHPIDRLLRELIDTRRAATAEEVAGIAAHIAAAPLEPRMVPVPSELRGTFVAGQKLGQRASSLDVHLAKRFTKGQRAASTSAREYLDHLRRAVRTTSVQLVAYYRRGGYIACAISMTEEAIERSRLGTGLLPLLLVVYSIDRGIIVSGYQVSNIDQTGIPKEALWLNARSTES